jgi:SSS family solute:Na+ symporter
VKNLLPHGLIGLVMAGLIAAIMSHVAGALNSCTTIACVDFYLPFFRKNATEAQAVRFGKLVGIVVTVAGVLWAGVMVSHSDKPVFIYLLNAYGYFTPGITTMFLLGIFWKRTTSAGALTAAALGLPLSIALHFAFPGLSFMNRTGMVFWLCMAAAVVVSLYTKPKPVAELDGLIWSIDSMSLPKEQRAQMRGLRNPLIWWAIVNAAVIGLYIKYH